MTSSSVQEHPIVSKATCIVSLLYLIIAMVTCIYWFAFWGGNSLHRVVGLYTVFFAFLTTVCTFPEEWINIRHFFLNFHLTAYRTHFGRFLLYMFMVPLIISANVDFGFGDGRSALHILAIFNVIFACFYIIFAVVEFVLGMSAK